jgi:flagellin
MIIQHNLSALNANRQLNIVRKTGSKSAEKLSSGYRINRAADDAAGLSISEKMRKQIRGLTKAKENVEDGISLCQVADGAMAEMHDMTNRMNELCVQAANGTNSADDRSYIQMEIDNIVEEFGRIINTTKFNEVYIFRGEEPFQALAGSEIAYAPIGSGIGINLVEGITAFEGSNFGDALDEDIYNSADWVTTSTPYSGAKRKRNCAWIDFTDFEASSREEFIAKLNGQGFDSSCCYCDLYAGIKFVSSVTKDARTSPNGISYDYHQLPLPPAIPDPSNSKEQVRIDLNDIWNRYEKDKSKSLGEVICESLVDVIEQAGMNEPHSLLTQDLVGYAYKKGTGKLYILDSVDGLYSPDAGSSTFSITPRSDTGELETVKMDTNKPVPPKVGQITTQQLAIHAGSDADGTNKVIMKMPTFKNENLKINSVSVLTEDLATNSIDVLTDVLQVISSNRSRIGAYQNRLEHTSLNLDNIVENTTDSESKIRDTDMANEIVRYSNNTILTQAGQSILSQANNNTQAVLSLLSA